MPTASDAYGIGRIPNVVRSPNPFSLCHAKLDPILPLRRDRVSALSAERFAMSRRGPCAIRGRLHRAVRPFSDLSQFLCGTASNSIPSALLKLAAPGVLPL
jgi:hypothetical protein